MLSAGVGGIWRENEGTSRVLARARVHGVGSTGLYSSSGGWGYDDDHHRVGSTGGSRQCLSDRRRRTARGGVRLLRLQRRYRKWSHLYLGLRRRKPDGIRADRIARVRHRGELHGDVDHDQHRGFLHLSRDRHHGEPGPQPQVLREAHRQHRCRVRADHRPLLEHRGGTVERSRQRHPHHSCGRRLLRPHRSCIRHGHHRRLAAGLQRLRSQRGHLDLRNGYPTRRQHQRCEQLQHQRCERAGCGPHLRRCDGHPRDRRIHRHQDR